MAQLPHDLITEILSYLPVKTLLRFRCFSKSLCTIIDSPDFIKLHHRTTSSNRTHLKIILGDLSRLIHQTRGVPVHVFDIDDDDDVDLSPLEFHKYWYRTHIFDIPVRVFAHCNGLVVLEVDFFSLVVWNPSMQKCGRLPLLPEGERIEQDHTWIKGLCFGYDSSIDDYKVFLMEDRWFWSNPSSMIWILGLRSGYWRRIEIPHNLNLITGKFKNCFVDGAFYFLCLNDVIFSFDLANETFSKVSSPDFGRTRCYQTNLQVVEGYLCVGFFFWEKPFELYARKKNDVGEYSWTKLFSITNAQLFQINNGSYFIDLLKIGDILGVSKDGNKIFVSNRYMVHLCDFKEKIIKTVVEGDKNNQKAFFCIESLVWIDVEEKREKQKEKERRHNVS